MDNSDFTTVFNIVEAGYRQWWLCLMSIAIATVFALLFGGFSRLTLQSNSYRERGIRRLLVFQWVFLVAAVVWSAVAFATTYPEYRTCYVTMESGKASYVEGTVDNFFPMPYEGHVNESFDVKGVPFSYSDYSAPGFTQTSGHGGPMRSGLYVRIWYLGNDILKLQIKKSSAGATAISSRS